MTFTRRRALTALVALAIPSPMLGQIAARPPLGAPETDAIARLLMMEDRRQLDTAEIARLFSDAHPELRRRAALAVAHIADKRGIALLRARPLDADTAVAATVVFAVGQLRDTLTIPWFDSLLSNPKSAPTVATAAAAALGKIKTAAARAVLARYLTNTPAGAGGSEVVGEALLSIGRAIPRDDIAPIVKWTASPLEEVRWRATWALFRPRDPAAVPTLLALSNDRSGHVRSWAVRGLTRSQADSAGIGAKAEARLLRAVRDTDRRVRTEAVRALGTYSDSAAINALVSSLESSDRWIAVSAAEGLGRIGSGATVPPLLSVASRSRSCAVRVTAMQALQLFAPFEATNAAVWIARDTVPLCRLTAVQTLMRDTSGVARRRGAVAAIDSLLEDPTPAVRSQAWQAHFSLLDATLAGDARRSARRTDLASPDPTVRAAALRAMAVWADTSDLATLFDQYERTRADSSPAIASAAVAAIAAVQRRHGAGGATFLSRFSSPENPILRRDIDRAFGPAARAAWGLPAPRSRPLAEFREIVERWVVPDYAGAPRPRSRWQTPRGAIELELYPGDAPVAVDDFVRTIESGAIVGTEFSRVVPDFVDQQRTIRDGNVLRDEVNRYPLTRGNLSWATGGLDTGSPGYTLNHTPQPHNEGDFTSLGRVISGMDAVDRIELGDRIIGARMVPARRR